MCGVVQWLALVIGAAFLLFIEYCRIITQIDTRTCAVYASEKGREGSQFRSLGIRAFPFSSDSQSPMRDALMPASDTRTHPSCSFRTIASCLDAREIIYIQQCGLSEPEASFWTMQCESMSIDSHSSRLALHSHACRISFTLSSSRVPFAG